MQKRTDVVAPSAYYRLARHSIPLALADRLAPKIADISTADTVNGFPIASRLRTASYGEEDSEHANAHEEIRRLNRRVALVVRLQP